MPKAKKAVLADAVKVDPKHYKVEVDNDRVRVVRINYGPREKSVMHGHPASVTIFLNDGEFRFTYPDGKTETIKGKRGQALFLDAFQHLPENLSGKPFEAIIVELKG